MTSLNDHLDEYFRWCDTQNALIPRGDIKADGTDPSGHALVDVPTASDTNCNICSGCNDGLTGECTDFERRDELSALLVRLGIRNP